MTKKSRCGIIIHSFNIHKSKKQSIPRIVSCSSECFLYKFCEIIRLILIDGVFTVEVSESLKTSSNKVSSNNSSKKGYSLEDAKEKPSLSASKINEGSDNSGDNVKRRGFFSRKEKSSNSENKVSKESISMETIEAQFELLQRAFSSRNKDWKETENNMSGLEDLKSKIKEPDMLKEYEFLNAQFKTFKDAYKFCNEEFKKFKNRKKWIILESQKLQHREKKKNLYNKMTDLLHEMYYSNFGNYEGLKVRSRILLTKLKGEELDTDDKVSERLKLENKQEKDLTNDFFEGKIKLLKEKTEQANKMVPEYEDVSTQLLGEGEYAKSSLMTEIGAIKSNLKYNLLCTEEDFTKIKTGKMSDINKYGNNTRKSLYQSIELRLEYIKRLIDTSRDDNLMKKALARLDHLKKTEN